MIISLVGYMGSGKSHISKTLGEKINFKIFDLDKEISKKKNMTIPEIFEKKGEIYFRKSEKETLEIGVQLTGWNQGWTRSMPSWSATISSARSKRARAVPEMALS